jgi:phage terminase large subunit-like protein
MPTALELEVLARAARLTLAERQATDPLRLWVPTVKQRPFIESVLHPEVSGYWENWLCGANRFGKTSTGTWLQAKFAREGIEPLHPAYSTLPDGTTLEVRDRATSGWVFGLDSNMIRDILQPRLFDNGFLKPGQPEPFIPQREIQEWRPGDQILRLRCGSVIGYKSCESPATKSAGSGLDWIHFDEPPPRNHYTEATIRVAAGRRLRVFATATLLPPEGHVETISWVYSDIIAPILEGRKRDIGLFTASIYDNPHLDPEEIARLESRYPLGSLSRKIRLNGELVPGIAGAVAYGNFSRHIHVRPQPTLSPYRPLCWLWDFNVEPFCVTVGQREPDLFRVYSEIVLDEGGIEDQVDEFRRRYPAHPQEIWIYGDATGGNRSHQTARSSYDLIFELMRGYGSRIRFKLPEANPLEVDRMNALNVALRDPYGASHISIDPSCIETIIDFEQVLADPRGGIKKTYNRRDPYSRRTHLTDEIGYWVNYEMPVRLARANERTPMVPGPGYGVQVKAASYGRGSF